MMTEYETLADLQQMTAKEAISEAVSLANLGQLPEGPNGQLEAIGLAQAYALIAIAKLLEGVVGEAKSGRKYIRTYDQSPSSTI